MVSMRDNSPDPDTDLPNSNPVEDQAVDTFHSTAGDKALRKDGTCNFGTTPDDEDEVLGGDQVVGNCEWNDNDDATDADGNLIMEYDVAAGKTSDFYAWIGSKDGDEFDSDKFEAQTARVSAKFAQDMLKITSTINEHAFADENGQKVDLRADSSVTFTVQLRNMTAGDVARSGVKIRVKYEQGPDTGRSYTNTHETELVTDDNGQVSFTASGPADGQGDNARLDDLTFSELHPVTGAVVREEPEDIHWVEDIPVLMKTTLETLTYVLAGNPTVSAIVRLWDQYGNSHRSRAGQTATITIGDVNDARTVISRGYARWSRRPADSQTVVAGTPITVSYAGVIAYSRDANGYLLDNSGDQIDSDTTADGTQPTTNIYQADGTTLWSNLDPVYEDGAPPNIQDGHQYRAGSGSVHVVTKASSANVGTDALHVSHLIADDDVFLTATSADGNATLIYSYDDDDIFINSDGESSEIGIARFEGLLTMSTSAAARAIVNVIAYDVDGTSIFRVQTKAG